MRYDPRKIEAKWQQKWLQEKIYEPNLKKAKRPFYNLMMFPYPSAEGLHVGNMYAFTGADIYGRFKRMQGHDVFEPIGLDGFGIHSENYAIKIKKHPVTQAKVSERNFYRQLEILGNGFAWDEKLETYDLEYYKWTQWIFVQMFKRGLAYRKKASVNWCPSCKTVLADEQVVTGKCERCGTEAVKKELEQWFFKITDYSERLLKNLEKIDWSERVKIAQRNWIGKSEGAIIRFSIKGTSDVPKLRNIRTSDVQNIEVFTTRPDTLFGATYVVLAPEHLLMINNKFRITNYRQVEVYIRNAKGKSEVDRIAEGWEKTGIELKGIKAINPANQEEIPIWVADYVLGHVGTGAIMAVPAHNQRDFEFAKKHRLPIVEVIEPLFIKIDDVDGVRPGAPFKKRDAVVAVIKHWAEDKYLCLKWKKTDWRGFVIGGLEGDENMVEAAVREIREETGYSSAKFVRNLGGVVHAQFYHAVKGENRWARFHGLYFELTDGARSKVAENEKQIHDVLWIERKEVDRFLGWVTDMRLFWHRASNPDDFPGRSGIHESSRVVEQGILTRSGKFDGINSEQAKWEITKFVGGKKTVNYRLRDWLISRQRYWGPPIPMIHCKKCGWVPVPEKDLPVKLPFVKNFRPTGTDQSPLASVPNFYKVRCPKCGSWARRETDVSDTFLDSAWYYLRYPSTRSKNIAWDSAITKKWLPVDAYIGGAEHSVLHLLYSRFLAMVFHDLKLLHFEEPFTKFRAHGLLIKDGAKMSKSKGNVVNPDDYIRAYGADALRMYLMFLGPFEQGGDFRDTGIRGITRFLERVWNLVDGHGRKNPNSKFKTELNRLVHKTIKKITEDIEGLQYNTAISALMILLNEFEKDLEAATPEHWSTFLRLLAPFAPHLTEELWQTHFVRKGKQFYSIHQEPWPMHDSRLITEKTFELVIQVDGKVRDRVSVPTGTPEARVREIAKNREALQKYLGSAAPKKVIYIRDRLINFVR